jgi:hypothetical protein
MVEPFASGRQQHGGDGGHHTTAGHGDATCGPAGALRRPVFQPAHPGNLESRAGEILALKERHLGSSSRSSPCGGWSGCFRQEFRGSRRDRVALPL